MSGARGRGAASPGLLRRRYSVPETVMRKYKLAQQKSESEESEVGSAPSPRGWSPARRGQARVLLGAARPSPLLRRLWGRQGGSHSELRYWDSCSASTDTCEACRKLSEKCIPVAIRNETHQTSPSHKLYRPSRSPKKIVPFASQGFSPERYITHLENARDILLRETKSQITSPSLLASASTPSERSSFKTASLTEGSPKLRLSSLATSSYPTTDANSVSDVTSEITRSSTSYSSDDVTQSRSKVSTRPETAGVSSTNDFSDAVSENPKKRRKSVCIYMNSFDSPTVEIRSTSITDSSVPLSQESCSNDDLDNSSKSQILEELNQNIDYSLLPESSSAQATTTTSEKTTTTAETSNYTSSTRNQETSSPSDSAVSTRSSMTTSVSRMTDKDNSKNSTPSKKDDYDGDGSNNYRNNNLNNVESSDTGISETILNDCDSNKNYINSNDDSDQNLSKSGSISNSDNMSTTDVTSDVVTCIENPAYNKLMYANLKNSKLECLEVVVSETLSSSAFLDQEKIKSKDSSHDQEHRSDHNNKLDKIKSNKDNFIKPFCNLNDIDQYVSSILIDSLNTMTDQINEINLNTDDEFKLNILEKEIKVKLQNVCASPINLPNSTLISSLLTQMPDRDLLETTIIEEQPQSYATESANFSLQNKSELLDSREADVYQDEDKSYYLDNDLSNLDDSDTFKYPDSIQPQECILNIEGAEMASMDNENSNNNLDSSICINNVINNITNSGQFYLSNSTGVDHENNKSYENEASSKAVLQKLNKMFENSTQNMNVSMDSNYNVCLDDSTNSLFCGSVYRDISHLEMSTDVDVFVDNSLNKMMNSIEIDYTASDLCSDTQNMSLENRNTLSENLENSLEISVSERQTETKSSSPKNKVGSSTKKGVISNIGSGSMYQKPLQGPLLVPRFSAVPHSESMEVNTSSDDDASSCGSDCLSIVDSLDDPNSPRPLATNYRMRKKLSKHDNTPVRGDIITLLPENTNKVGKQPNEKNSTFFVPIKEDSIECESGKLVVAEHMPEKIKEKLYKRQQKRELRKEHIRRKRTRQLKRELENQKLAGIQRLRDEHEKECLEILSQLIDQVVEVVGNEDADQSNPSCRMLMKKHSPDSLKQRSHDKKQLQRSDKNHKRDDNKIKDFESFVIDKQGNIQMTRPAKTTAGQDDSKTSSSDKNTSRSKTQKSSILKPSQNNPTENKYEFQQPRYNPNLTGPRRLYQKTEFKEGNKHVEILEIVECVDSSPEPISDDNQNYLSSTKHTKKSKIPVPISEKLHRVSKSKSVQKPYKRCRSPCNKSQPFNISAAKNDQNNYMNANSKVDQLIANILIDAFNKDIEDSKQSQNLFTSFQRKPAHPIVKKLASTEMPNRRASIPQQNHEKIAVIPKYKQKFDAIPEERSSVSMESSNEDMTKANRRQSLPAEIKFQQSNVNNNHNSFQSENNIARKLTPMGNIPEVLENIATIMEVSCNDIDKKASSSPMKTLNDVQTQSSPCRTNKDIHDVSTSPMPQFVSAATSPIPAETMSGVGSHSKKIKGKQALGTRDGWAGFCRPQTGYSPEHEGTVNISSPTIPHCTISAHHSIL